MDLREIPVRSRRTEHLKRYTKEGSRRRGYVGCGFSGEECRSGVVDLHLSDIQKETCEILPVGGAQGRHMLSDSGGNIAV